MSAPAKPRVVYWNNMPAPYVVERFDELARRGGLEFEAWFDCRREPDRSWDVDESGWSFRWRYLGRDPDTPPTPAAAIRRLRETRPELLVCHYASAAWAAGALAARSLGCRVAFRVLPSSDAWVRRRRWKEWSKRFLFSRVDGVKTPGPDGRRTAIKYGVPGRRIHFVTQSIDVARFGAGIPPVERAERRRALGLSGIVFLYAGRLWRGKGLDHLFEAYRSLAAGAGAGLLVVGDGVDEARYRRLAEGWSGVRFAGFVQPREIASWYALADVFVLPTLGDPHGLVIEEAMASGLPVIATSAAGDVRRRLGDESAGFVVPPADPDALCGRMRALADAPELRASMAAAGRRLAAERGHDRWVADFERFVDAVLAMPRRRRGSAAASGQAGATSRP